MVIACGVCMTGIARALFPPSIPWAVIASLWFLSLAIIRTRFELPSRVMPRPVAAVVVLCLCTVLGAWAGPAFHLLLLLPFCVVFSLQKLLFRGKAGSSVGRKATLALLVFATVVLGVSAGIQYRRVSRNTPAQRVLRVAWTPGAEIEVARIARAQVSPIGDYEAILASTESPLVAEAIGRHLECTPGDISCAAVLVAVLERLEGGFSTGRVQAQLELALGPDLIEAEATEYWRIRLAELEAGAASK